MLYNTRYVMTHVMLYNKCLCYITHMKLSYKTRYVMLYNTWYVMLYNT